MFNWKMLIPAILLFSVCVASQPVETSGGLTAKVIRVKGAPHVERGGKDVALKKNMDVSEGEYIITGAGDSLVLELGTGDTIVISQLSRMKLELKDGDVNISHESGAVWSKVKKQTGSDERSFKVKTPTAVAGVRGTAFSSTIESPESAWLCVCEGIVEISRGDKTVSARNGQGVKTMSTSAAPTRPMSDAMLLERAHGAMESCLRCHQGGYSREDMY